MNVLRGGTTIGLGPAALAAGLGIDKAVRRGLLDAADELVRVWSQIFPGEGSGRTYSHLFVTVSGSGGSRVVPIAPRKGSGFSATHQASKHPEAPAVDTGTLRASINRRALPNGDVRVGTGVKYAKYLEFGVGPGHKYGPHPAGIEIKPRPHARPAAQMADLSGSMVTGVRAGSSGG